MTAPLALAAIITLTVRRILTARRHLRLALEIDGDATCHDLCPCQVGAEAPGWPAPGVYSPRMGR